MTANPGTRRVVETAVAVHVGFVDAFGFVLLGGFFVSSINATTTTAGVALGGGTWGVLGLGAAIVGGFLVGVVTAAVVGHRWTRQRVSRVLFLVAGLLAAGGAIHWFTAAPVVIGFVLALAMGAENTLLETGGLLVETAQRITDRLLTKEAHQWLHYLWLWGAVTLGAILGAWAYRLLAFDSLWIAVGAALLAGCVLGNAPAGGTDPRRDGESCPDRTV
ncbi:YoaK family protein [Rhodococcus opacus]|nr:YoaK family protein [Rhodococcus opacus]